MTSVADLTVPPADTARTGHSTTKAQREAVRELCDTIRHPDVRKAVKALALDAPGFTLEPDAASGHLAVIGPDGGRHLVPRGKENPRAAIRGLRDFARRHGVAVSSLHSPLQVVTRAAVEAAVPMPEFGLAPEVPAEQADPASDTTAVLAVPPPPSIPQRGGKRWSEVLVDAAAAVEALEGLAGQGQVVAGLRARVAELLAERERARGEVNDRVVQRDAERARRVEVERENAQLRVKQQELAAEVNRLRHDLAVAEGEVNKAKRVAAAAVQASGGVDEEQVQARIDAAVAEALAAEREANRRKRAGSLLAQIYAQGDDE